MRLADSQTRLLVADVVVEVRSGAFERTFTYLIPDALRARAVVGAMILVSFGPQKLLGYIAGLREVNPTDLDIPVAQLKPILDVLNAPPLDADLLNLAAWISEEYVSGLGAALHASVPPAAKTRIRTVIERTDREAGEIALTPNQERLLSILEGMKGGAAPQTLKRTLGADAALRAIRQLREKGLVRQTLELVPPPRLAKSAALVRLTGDQEAVDAFFTGDGRKRPAQANLLMALLDHPEGAMAQSELLEKIGAGADALRKLQQANLVALEAEEGAPAEPAAAPTLTPSQSAAVKAVSEALARQTFSSHLLYGVTASGKTEVYLRAAAECLRQGRGALYLVPEIALTAQVIGQVRARFGKSVAVLHSHLADAERFEQWQQIRAGVTPIVIGARSAVFAPVPNLGLVILDEEHEPSYKQEKQPRYHTRQVALERARRSQAVVLMGSATPSIETFFTAESGGHGLLQMRERVSSRPLPAVEPLDLRELYQNGKPAALSPALCDAMREALDAGQQAILFLNRRAYASFLLCRFCGHVCECPHCSVSLAYHQVVGQLKCHHCDYFETAPSRCPKCKSDQLKPLGVGTQRVEEEAKALFPNARVARLDRDVLVKREAYLDVIRQFRTGEANILVGTQMVAKGLDFPNVAVVGVVNADTAMHLPDFRAGERTFQLLTQVAGRAGRGDVPGRVIVQTFCPEHSAVEFGRNHDYSGFFTHEIDHRKQLYYPPFSRLVNLVVSHTDEGKASQAAEALAKRAREVTEAEQGLFETLGPTPCPIARVKTFYRRHVLLKAPPEADAAVFAREVVKGIDALGGQITIDIDPQSLM